ncbi:MAG: DUF393 domain-containing protein [Bacteroidales bacterium]|nr:DUF393 domain-containing protein [Bacteroidales bacterium]
MNRNENNIIIYDDDCILCNKAIQLVISLDKNKRFLVSHPHTNWFKNQNVVSGKLASQTLVYMQNSKDIYIQSDAILKICQDLGGLWRFTSVFYLVPRIVRDRIYRIIANNRRTVLQKKTCCINSNISSQLLT